MKPLCMNPQINQVENGQIITYVKSLLSPLNKISFGLYFDSEADDLEHFNNFHGCVISISLKDNI